MDVVWSTTYSDCETGMFCSPFGRLGGGQIEEYFKCFDIL